MFSVDVAYAGRNRGTYATYVNVKNIGTGEITSKSFNQLSTILNAYELN